MRSLRRGRARWRPQRSLGWFLGAAILVGAGAQPAAAEVTVTELGTLGCNTSEAVAVTSSGQVLGESCLADGTRRAFSWTQEGGMIDLGTLWGTGWTELGSANLEPWVTWNPYAVNDNGQVVGHSGYSPTSGGADVNQAFSWTQAGGMVDLGTLGGPQSYAEAVNDSGQVAGSAPTAGDVDMHAFSWTAAGGMIDLGTLGGPSSFAFALNDTGQVIGWSEITGSSSHAFSWTQGGGMIDLGTLGGPGSFANAVNNSGQVAGGSYTGDMAFDPFSWTAADGMIDLGTLGGNSGRSLALNDSGQVVGYSYTAGDAATHAFSWTQEGGMVDLGTLGGANSIAYAVSDTGEVVGKAEIEVPGVYHAFSWTQEGGMVDLSEPGGGTNSAFRRSFSALTGEASTENSTAIAVNNAGQAVGYVTTDTGHTHAALFSASPPAQSPPTATAPPTTTTTATPTAPAALIPTPIAAGAKPKITAVHESASTWGEGTESAQISRTEKPPVGSTFSFSLNEQAAVSFSFTQRLTGREVGQNCVSESKENAKRKACKRTVTAGTISFTGHNGTNKVTFQGRISPSKKLKPGRYTLVITATNAGGQRSNPAQLTFTIVQ